MAMQKSEVGVAGTPKIVESQTVSVGACHIRTSADCSLFVRYDSGTKRNATGSKVLGFPP